MEMKILFYLHINVQEQFSICIFNGIPLSTGSSTKTTGLLKFCVLRNRTSVDFQAPIFPSRPTIIIFLVDGDKDILSLYNIISISI